MQVGAVSLRATLNCEAFADAHKNESHFDRSSFVGLAWRPAGESCCVGALATNSNLASGFPPWTLGPLATDPCLLPITDHSVCPRPVCAEVYSTGRAK